MTAPLPPPTVTKIEFLDTPLGYERANVRYWNEAAVKLAVREALQRMLEQETYAYARARIRAMLKDYE
jgi:hypothetical protein